MKEKLYRGEQIIGKEVYNANALHVGTVKDVAFGEEGRTELIIKRGDGEAMIPFKEIYEIADIVLLRTVTEQQPLQSISSDADAKASATKICTKCGRENRHTAKFCAKCGQSFI